MTTQLGNKGRVIIEHFDEEVSYSNRLPVDAGIGGGVYTVPPFTTTGKYTGNQTNVTIATPTAGKRLQIIGVLITSDDSLFTCSIEFLTSGQTIQEHYEQGSLGTYIPVNITGDTDEVLSINISDSAVSNWFITINYQELD